MEGNADCSWSPFGPAQRAVGAKLPSMAIWCWRRSVRSGYMPAGGSKRITPEDRNVNTSVGRNCIICVRVSPFGHVRVICGAKPWPCR